METRKFLLFSTFYPPYHLGGDATHVENLAELLSKQGHEVHVVHLVDSFIFKKGRNEINKMEVSENDGITVHRLISPYGNLSLFKAYTLGGSNYYINKCQNLVDRIKPEIIHHHNIAGFGPSILKMKASDKNLYTAHDYWLICQNSRLMRLNRLNCSKANNCIICQLYNKRPAQVWRVGNSFRRTLASSIDTIISPSRFLAQELKKFNINNNIEIIPNFVKKPLRSCRKNHPKDHFLFVGLLDAHKGIMELLANFDGIYREFNYPLHIVGSGPLEQSISKFIINNHMEDKIVLRGRISYKDLVDEYVSAIATIVPSIWLENNPMVAIESLSYGTPVIGSCNGGIPEIVSSLDPLLIYKDIKDINKSIRLVMENPSLGDTAMALYQRKYSESSYLNLYCRLIN